MSLISLKSSDLYSKVTPFAASFSSPADNLPLISWEWGQRSTTTILSAELRKTSTNSWVRCWGTTIGIRVHICSVVSWPLVPSWSITQPSWRSEAGSGSPLVSITSSIAAQPSLFNSRMRNNSYGYVITSDNISCHFSSNSDLINETTT